MASRQHRGQGALALLGVVLAIAGCGSSGSGSGPSSAVSPSTYAASLCNAVGPFESDIANRRDALDPASIKSPAEGKATLEGFLDAIASDTSKAKAQLQAAGVPAVADGRSIAHAFVHLFGRLQTTLQGAASQARALPTSSPTAFKNAAAQLGNSVKASMGDLGSSLSRLHSSKLEQAAAKVSACQKLG